MEIKIANRIIEYEVDENKCWNVTSHKQKGHGYPVAYFNKKITMIHRAMMIFNILETDSLSSNVHVLHSCDNTKCINPNHLRCGNMFDNMKDRSDRNRGNFSSGENHYLSKTRSEDEQLIKSAYEHKLKNQRELAEIFGVDQTLISLIVNGKGKYAKLKNKQKHGN